MNPNQNTAVPIATPKMIKASQNPRKMVSDWLLPMRLKAWWKGSKDNHTILGNETIENEQGGSFSRGSVVLGAIPTQKYLEKEEYDDVVCMLAGEEKGPMNYSTPPTRTDIPLLDHGVISQETGKNIATDEIKKQVDAIADKIKDGKKVYIHCMAGKSRSFLFVISLLYFHPELLTQKEKEQCCVVDGSGALVPSVTKIASFIKSQRPDVKKVEKMDGDQAGFLGLMALEGECKRLSSTGEKLSGEALGKIAKDLALVLKEPLDLAYRDIGDIEKQKQQFIQLCNSYGVDDLLSKMLPPGKEGRGFSSRLNELSPSEQAHLLILLKAAENTKGVKSGNFSTDYLASQLVKNSSKKLTAGDQVELLRAFPDCGLTQKEIQKKIDKKERHWWGGETNQSKLSRHNSVVQTTELRKVVNENTLKNERKTMVFNIDKVTEKHPYRNDNANKNDNASKIDTKKQPSESRLSESMFVGKKPENKKVDDNRKTKLFIKS